MANVKGQLWENHLVYNFELKKVITLGFQVDTWGENWMVLKWNLKGSFHGCLCWAQMKWQCQRW